MKRFFVLPAMLIASLLVGCTVEDIPSFPSSPRSEAPALKTLDFSGTVTFEGKNGNLESMEVEGRITYDLKSQLQKSAARIVAVEVSVEAKAGGAFVGGYSEHSVTLDDNGESQSLVTRHSFIRSGNTLSLNIQLEVSENQLEFAGMWISGGSRVP